MPTIKKELKENVQRTIFQVINKTKTAYLYNLEGDASGKHFPHETSFHNECNRTFLVLTFNRRIYISNVSIRNLTNQNFRV